MVGFGSRRPQAYVAFRKSFALAAAPKAANLRIFADSRYILWVNGHYVLRGPCRFDPKRTEYDTVDVSRHPQNRPERAGDTCAQLPRGGKRQDQEPCARPDRSPRHSGPDPISTDVTWRCNSRTRHLPSPDAWSSIPDIIDSRIDDGSWINTDFDDSAWEHAVNVDGGKWGPMQAREIPLPRETELKGLKVLPSGKPLSEQMPVEIKGGGEIVLDLGRMAMSYANVNLEADSGSVLRITYALRYVDGHPEEGYGGGITYTARAGRQSFIGGDVWGARYLTVRCDSGRMTLQGFKAIDRRYPFTRIGSFKCSDEILNQLWEMRFTPSNTVNDGYGSDARERDEWLQDPAQPNFLPTRIALAGPGRTASSYTPTRDC